MLAYSLGYTDQLAEPLGRMYHRRNLNEDYNGNNMRNALRMAIEQNQIDERYKKMWTDMLNGIKDGFLAGTRIDGFKGAVFMPKSPKTRGLIYMDFVSYAIGKMASFLSNSTDKDKQFTSILYTAVHAYLQGGERFFERLEEQAKIKKWPLWACEILEKNRNTIILYNWA